MANFGHVVNATYDKAGQMHILQFGQQLMAHFGHMVKVIYHNQASKMHTLVWSSVNSPVWSHGQGPGYIS